MKYEPKALFITLVCLSLGLGVYYLSYAKKYTRGPVSSAIIVYAKETKTLEQPKSDRYAIPKSIIRFNRRTGKPETIKIPTEIGEAICSKDWPCESALKIASCESDFSTRAIGPTRDKGLFQLNPVHKYSDAQLFDRDTNINLAYKLWKTKGWKPWVSSYKCTKVK